MSIKYEVQNYSHLKNIGKISEPAMQLHFKLYAGYVTNINAISEKLYKINKENSYAADMQEYNELHRRLGWEFNGMRLHEIFFGKLKVEANDFEAIEFANLEIVKEIGNKWLSFANFKNEFYNVAKMRGFGWTLLVRDTRSSELFITWVNEHDVGLPADCLILLSIDILEHAYIIDFATDRALYLDSIFAHIDFAKV